MFFVTAAMASIALLQPLQPAPPLTNPVDAELDAAMGPLEPPPPTPVPGLLGDSLLSYTFLEIGGISRDVDDISEDVDAYYVSGSIGFLGILYAFLGYEQQETDFMNIDGDLWRLGAGAHVGSDTFNVLGEIGFLFNDISGDSIDTDSTGYEIRAGVRWLPIEWATGGLEFDGNLIWVDLEDRLASSEDGLGGEIGLRAHFLKAVSIGAMYTKIDDDDQVGLNARFSL